MNEGKHAVIYSEAVGDGRLVRARLWDGSTASFPSWHYPEPWGCAHEWAESAGATTVEIIPPAEDRPLVKYVKVPQRDLDMLEQARKDLWELFPGQRDPMTLKIMEVSEVMWRIANRKYPEVKPNG